MTAQRQLMQPQCYIPQCHNIQKLQPTCTDGRNSFSLESVLIVFQPTCASDVVCRACMQHLQLAVVPAQQLPPAQGGEQAASAPCWQLLLLPVMLLAGPVARVLSPAAVGADPGGLCVLAAAVLMSLSGLQAAALWLLLPGVEAWHHSGARVCPCPCSN